MSEMERQQERIAHLERKTGKTPTVLDVEPSAFEKLKLECISMAFDWRDTTGKRKEECLEILDHGITLFGVRFVRGRVG